MAVIYKVCYIEQPFTMAELDKYKNYFEESNWRRILSQDCVRAMEDDYITATTRTDEECNSKGYLTEDDYNNFRNKLGEVYDLLLKGEIDYVEFEQEIKYE